jgi:hypothetical protein
MDGANIPKKMEANLKIIGKFFARTFKTTLKA